MISRKEEGSIESQQNSQSNNKHPILAALSKPIALLLSHTERKNAKKAADRQRRSRRERRQLAIAENSKLYHNFTIRRAREQTVLPMEHNAVFEVNGLGRFDRWYNTTSIRLHEKSEQAVSRYRREFEHLFEHPAGWCSNRREIFKRNFYDLLLEILELLPGIILLKNKLTTPLRRAGNFLAHTDSSTFSLRSMARAVPIFCNWIAPILLAIGTYLYIYPIPCNMTYSSWSRLTATS